MEFLGVGLFEVALTLIVGVLAFGPAQLARSVTRVAELISRGGR